MNDVRSVWFDFPETVINNIDFFKKFWTPTFPKAFDTAFLPNSKNDWHPRENEKNVIDKKVIYSINEHGFRKYPQLNNNSSKKIFCFGCDLTFGIGLSDDETWPYILSQKIGVDFTAANFGIEKSSLEYNAMCYYQMMQVLSKEEYPSAVFFLVSNPYRRFYIGNFENEEPMAFHLDIPILKENTYENMVKSLIEGDEIHEKKINYYAYTSVLSEFYNLINRLNFIDQISKNRNIPWFWYGVGDFYEKIPQDIFKKYFDIVNYPEENGKMIPINKSTDTNRDGSSWGKSTNEEIASRFKNLYERHILRTN